MFKRTIAKLVLASFVAASAGCALPKPSPPTSVFLFPAEEDLVLRGKYAEAEAAFRQLVESEKGTKGASLERRIDALRGLAVSIDLQGRPAEGEPILRETLQLAEANLGPESLTRGRVYEALGSLGVDLGRAVEAESYYRKAHSIFAKVLGHVEERGVRVVADRVIIALDHDEPLLLALAPPAPPPQTLGNELLPAHLRDVDVERACAADYDRMLAGGDA